MMKLTRQSRALLSWQIDVITALSVLVLLSAWISDLRSNQANYISASFLQNGFCLSPLFDSTHIICSIFDACGGTIFIGIAMLSSPRVRQFLLPMGAYVISHAYGHYVTGTELVKPADMDADEVLPLRDTVTLAAILSLGPISGANYLVKAGKMRQRYANTGAMAVLILLVSIFVLCVRKPRFSLLYINISIILTIHFPKVYAIGYTLEKDVVARADIPLWHLNVAVDIFLATILFAEPFYCDTFVASIGGHLLFDVSLLLQAIAQAVTRAQLPEDQLKHDKVL